MKLIPQISAALLGGAMCVFAQTAGAQADAARLSALGVAVQTDPPRALTLEPEFAADTLSYRVQNPYGGLHATVISAQPALATSGVDMDGAQKGVAQNYITFSQTRTAGVEHAAVTVTAQDGSTRVYTLSIHTYPDLALRITTAHERNIALAISPPFSGEVFEYALADIVHADDALIFHIGYACVNAHACGRIGRAQSFGGAFLGAPQSLPSPVTIGALQLGENFIRADFREEDFGGADGAVSYFFRVNRLQALSAPQLAVRAGDESLDAKWDAHADAGVTGYALRWKVADADDFARGNAVQLPAAARAYTIHGLQNAVAYAVELAAHNADGVGTYARVQATPRDTAPGAPQNARASPQPGGVTFRWSPPPDDALGGAANAAALRYQIRWRAAAAAAFALLDRAEVAAGVTEYALGGLIPNRDYELQVRALGANNFGAWSARVTAVAGAMRPPPPQNVRASFGDARVTLSWSPPASDGGAEVSGYRYRWSNNGNDGTWESANADSGVAIANADARAHAIETLTNGVTYTLQLAAVNAVGAGAWSNAVQARPLAAPGMPQSLQAAQSARETLRITWQPPQQLGGASSAEVQYEIRWRETATATFAQEDAAVTAAGVTAYDLGGLTAGAAYAIEVRARSAAGGGEWRRVTAAAQRRRPDIPRNFRALSSGGAVLLTWTAPDDGGARIGTYFYRWSNDADNSAWESANAGDGTAIPGSANLQRYAIPGLQNGVTYEVQLAAANTFGTGEWTRSAFAVQLGAPGAPRNVRAESSGHDSLRVTWLPPAETGGADASDLQYILRWRESSDSDGAYVYGGTLRGGTDLDIENLRTGAEYTIEIFARSSGAEGTAWTSTTGTPRARTPRMPALRAAGGDAEIRLTWSPPDDDGGAAVTRYLYRWSNDGDGGDWESANAGGGIAIANSAQLSAFTIASVTNGATYEVQLAAANTFGAGAWSASAFARPLGAPGAVSGVTVTASDSVLQVAWQAPREKGGARENELQYRVRWKTTTASGYAHDSGALTATAFAIANLRNGLQYEVQVSAFNAVAVGAWSAAVQSKPLGAPGVPAVFTAAGGVTEVTLAWSPPELDGGAPVTSYAYRWSSDGDNSDWESANAGAGIAIANSAQLTEYAIPGLRGGVTYEVQLAAANTFGIGGWSESAFAQPRDVPGKTTLRMAAAADAAIEIAWSPPAADGGAAIATYLYRWSNDGDDATWESANAGDGVAIANSAQLTQFRIASLTNGATYAVQVTAANNVGAGEWSDSISARPLGVPGVPRGVTVAAADAELQIAWQPPLATGGAQADELRYKVRWKPAAANAYINESDAADTAAYTIENLTNGVTYDVQVSASNAVSGGEWSAAMQARPLAAPGVPQNLRIENLSRDSLRATWQAPQSLGGVGGGELRYQIRWRAKPMQNFAPENHADLDSETTQYDIANLTAGTEHSIEVRARSDGGDSAWTGASGTPRNDPPGKPAAFTATAGTAEVTLAWSPPEDDGGTAVTAYRYRWSTATPAQWKSPGGSGGTAIENSAQLAQYTVASLTNGLTYEMQLAADNAVGAGAWSDSVFAIPLGAPGVPRGVAIASADSELQVAWQPPQEKGGARENELQYRVRWKLASAGNYTGKSGALTATNFTIETLTNGTTYDVQVSAFNAVAEGAWSNAGQARPLTAPDMPQNLRIAELTRDSLRASWESPAQTGGVAAAELRYQIRWRETSAQSFAPEEETSIAAGVTQHDIANLTADTEYTVEVRARSDGGDGAWQSATGTPRNETPGKPASLTATAGAGEVTLAWSAPDDDGGTAVTSYLYRWSNDGDERDWESANGEDGVAIANSASLLQYAVPGLQNGLTYTVQLAAANTVGGGAWSDSASARPLDAPGVPRNFLLSAVDSGLQAEWEPPAQTGGAHAGELQYRLQWKIASAQTFESAVAAAGKTSHGVTGLTNGVEYGVQVRAENSAGESDWTAAAMVTPTDFTLDVDGVGGADWKDGILTARFLLGIAAANLADNLPLAQNARTETAIFAKLAASREMLNVDGGAAVTAADGILIARFLLGATEGEFLRGGQSDTAATEIAAAIRALLPPNSAPE